MSCYDRGLEFHSEVSKTSEIINKIKLMGIETNTLSNYLNELTEKTDAEASKPINVTNGSTFDFAFNIAAYDKGLNILHRFQDSLITSYDIYYKIINSSKAIEGKMNKKNYTKEEIDSFIVEMIKNLISLKNSSTINYNDEKDIVESVYNLAYRVIKLELKNNNESQLLQYIKQSDIDISYVNKEISKDLTKQNNSSINRILHEMDKNGLGSNYLNEELLLILAYLDDYNDIDLDELKKANDKIKVKINKIEKEIEKTQNEADECTRRFEYNFNSNEVKKIKNKLFKKGAKATALLSITLGITVLLTGLGFKGGKKLDEKTVYNTTKYSYDTIDNEENIEHIKEEEKDSKGSKQVIKYGCWKKTLGGFQRNVETYNVGEIEFESYDDYLNADYNELGIKPVKETETKEQLVPEDLYKDEYFEVNKVEQDLSKHEIIASPDASTFAYVTAGFTLVVCLLVFGFYDSNKLYDIGYKRCLEDLKNAKKHTKEYEQQMEEYNKLLEQLLKAKSKLDTEYLQSCEKYNTISELKGPRLVKTINKQ